MQEKKSFAVITGIYGQDGSYLAELLLAKGYCVLGIAQPADEQHTLYERFQQLGHFTVLHADLAEHEKILSEVATHGVDEFYNLAAISDLGTARAQPEQTQKVNFEAFHTLAQSLFSTHPQVRIFQALSSRILSPNAEGIIDEQSGIKNPQNPYDAAKRESLEKTILPLRAQGRFIASGFLCNHESPRRDERFVTARIVRTIARIEKEIETELLIGNVEAKRDWSHAKDIVAAMHAVLQVPESHDYVMGSGELHSVREFVTVAFRIAGIELAWSGTGVDTVAYDEGGVVRVRVSPDFYQPDDNPVVSDTTRLETIAHWKREYSFEELIASMLAGAREVIRGEV